MADLEDKQRIVEVASRQFMESGISKVTLDEVAAELGMSKKTMYKFFPSKEDLLKTIVHTMMNGVRARVEKVVNSDKPFVEKAPELLAIIGHQISIMSKQFLFDLQRFTPQLWKEIDDFRRQRILTSVQKMFVQAQQEGVFRKDLDIELFILVFVSAVQGIVNPQTLAQHSFSAAGALRGIFTIIFEGAMTEEARKNSHLFEQSMATLTER
ncbi:MAG TPA: TetR/AcrR family transcriptional regulator [Bacteroidota bacterium]